VYTNLVLALLHRYQNSEIVGGKEIVLARPVPVPSHALPYYHKTTLLHLDQTWLTLEQTLEASWTSISIWWHVRQSKTTMAHDRLEIDALWLAWVLWISVPLVAVAEVGFHR
jgi:hypothetical protein